MNYHAVICLTTGDGGIKTAMNTSYIISELKKNKIIFKTLLENLFVLVPTLLRWNVY